MNSPQSDISSGGTLVESNWRSHEDHAPELVPGNWEKEASHDKTPPEVLVESGLEVVHSPAYLEAVYPDSKLDTTTEVSSPTIESSQPEKAQRRQKICGLPRRIFWGSIIAGVILVIAALLGVVIGLLTSRNNSAQG
jgi:hypothetical protein